MNLITATAILKECGSIMQSGFTFLQFMRRNYPKAVDSKAEWLDYRANMSPSYRDPGPYIDKESTYDDCIVLVIDSEERDGRLLLKLTITMYDGNLFDGSRERVRCKFTCLLDYVPDDIIRYIEYKARQKTISIIEQEEEDARNKMIRDRTKSFIESVALKYAK
jgi:hypothetical protein